MIDECDYQLACFLLEQGSYAEAQALFSSLAQYRDAPDMVLECLYRDGLLLLSEGKYPEAIACFDSLGDYKQSPDKSDEAREHMYLDAFSAYVDCEFEKAADMFFALGGYRQSLAYLKQCGRRLEAELPEEDKLLLRPSSMVKKFENGKMYSIREGLVYIPDSLSKDTNSLVYYAGGLGDNLLYMEGVWYYFMNYAPDAVMLFFYESGYNHIEGKNLKAIELMEQLTLECGISIHGLVIAGSSHGCYTAMHSIAKFYSEAGIPPTAAFMLDAGLEWDTPSNLNAEECELVGLAETEVYLFEQEGVGLDKAPIRQLVEKGGRVTIVECWDDDHNRISVNAYKFGLFSWALGEFSHLDPKQYTLVKLY